jgi:hypothetical protein
METLLVLHGVANMLQRMREEVGTRKQGRERRNGGRGREFVRNYSMPEFVEEATRHPVCFSQTT